jgi:hypothetical protein
VLGLQDMVHVELRVAARGRRDGRSARRLAARELGFGDQQVDAPRLDREPDAIAVLTSPSGPPAAASGETCSTMVP